MTDSMMPRREVLTGIAVAGLAAAAGRVQAQPKPGGKRKAPMKDAPPAKPLSAKHRAVIESTAECMAAGRVCLARCTDHLASGTPMMAECQRAVMNMLVVVEAMADVAGYANSDPKLIAQLGKACAAFCTACAKACKPHAKHHAECKACHDACVRCARACNALST